MCTCIGDVQITPSLSALRCDQRDEGHDDAAHSSALSGGRHVRGKSDDAQGRIGTQVPFGCNVSVCRSIGWLKDKNNHKTGHTRIGKSRIHSQAGETGSAQVTRLIDKRLR